MSEWICPTCQQPVDPNEGHAWYRWRFHVDDLGHESYVRDASPDEYTHRGFCTVIAQDAQRGNIRHEEIARLRAGTGGERTP